VLLLAVVLHDSMKYGKDPVHTKHTVRNHDKIIADFIEDIAEVFEPVLGIENTMLLENCVRFHSGRWSTDISSLTKDREHDEGDDMMFYVHSLDMLSTADNLKMTDKQIKHYWPQAFEDDIPF